MVNKKKTYTPEDIVVYNHNKHKGIVAYNKPSVIRVISGSVLLYTGLATFPLPTGSILMVGLGSWLLGYDSKKIIKNALFRMKLIWDWAYCNRTPKRMKKTIKTRLLAW